MSPEPSQEPIEQNLKVPNLSENLQTEDESDTDEDVGSSALSGYIPLSQFPNDNDYILSDDEDDDNDQEDDFNQVIESDDFTPAATSSSPSAPVDTTNNSNYPSETIQVWSSNEYNSSTINLDAEKINQVKSMMKNFTLPVKSIPQWASSVSEDQWKDQLINRIKQIQKRDT